ncbi:hypothetical protein ACFDTO_03760 [Microbacteriaceae bacterium 4G12]
MGAMHTPIRLTSLALATVLLAGCTASDPQPETPVRGTKTTLPAEPLTVLADADPTANALGTSRALFAEAPVVVTAAADDPDAQLLAASAAVALGAPLLLTGGADGGAAAGVAEEIERLGADAVLDVGGSEPLGDASDGSGAPDVVSVAASASALAPLLPGDPETTPVPADSSAVAAVADLDRESPALLAADGGSDDSDGDASDADADDLPRTRPAAPLDGGTVVVTDEPASLASAATARAAGLPVQVLPADAPDPRTDPEFAAKLKAAAPETVLAVGASFASVPSLGWKIRSTITGTEVPGGGQTLFPGKRFVALYGAPEAPVLGVLGEQGIPETIARAESTAAPYREFTDDTVVPMLEVITTVAAGTAGSDGNYSNELPIDSLRPWVEAAGAAGMYVVLDLQPGRTDFLTQAKQYQELLELPYVGLALDPEWRLAPDQVHLKQIGSVSAAEVNEVGTWLADLTAEKGLPQKMFVLHQFQTRMIRDRPTVDTSHPELAFVIHVDGQGSQPAKQDTWRVLHQNAPAGVAWGWKNFYDEDLPPLTPEQTMTQVEPVPELVTYQ